MIRTSSRKLRESLRSEIHLTRYRLFSSSSSKESLRQLRLTGAPIVECRRALEATDGEVSKALEWLKVHGSAMASSKVIGRDSQEGLVGCYVSPDRQTGAVLKLKCETDFASRSPEFIHLLQAATLALGSASVAAGSVESDLLHDLPCDGLQCTVGDLLQKVTISIRENLSLSDATIVQGSEDSYLYEYIHNRSSLSKFTGSGAAMVELGPCDGNQLDQSRILHIGKQLAMHVLAAKPQYLTRNAVPDDDVQKAKATIASQLRDSEKPKDIVDQIVQGRLKKHFSDLCLHDQAHMIQDGNPPISEFLQSEGMRLLQFRLLQ